MIFSVWLVFKSSSSFSKRQRINLLSVVISTPSLTGFSNKDSSWTAGACRIFPLGPLTGAYGSNSFKTLLLRSFPGGRDGANGCGGNGFGKLGLIL